MWLWILCSYSFLLSCVTLLTVWTRWLSVSVCRLCPTKPPVYQDLLLLTESIRIKLFNMPDTSNKPLNPFRKQNTPSTPSNHLHSRWGDVSISVPTEGSWSQYDTSHHLTRHKNDHSSGYASEQNSHPARHRHPHPHPQSDDEDGCESTASTSTDTTSTSSSRRNSILLNTLNPARHISMRRRLSSRPHPPHRHTQSHSNSHSPAPSETQLEDILDENEHLITEKQNDFAYRPIRRDYPSEVAESRQSQTNRSHGHGQSQSQSQRQNPLYRTNTNTSTRFRYIPASASGSRYREEFGEIPPRSQSACSGSGSSRSRESRYSLSSSSGISDGLRYEHEQGRSRSKGSGSGPERGEKRLSFASSKFLTTAMVPDPDDLYD